MLTAPKHLTRYCGRDLDCEAAVTPFLIEFVRRLRRNGASPAGAAEQILTACTSVETEDSELAVEMRSLKALMVSVGWDFSEVDCARCSAKTHRERRILRVFAGFAIVAIALTYLVTGGKGTQTIIGEVLAA